MNYIFTADLHLDDMQPPCRTDNYWMAQTMKLEWLRDLCNDTESRLVVAGDIFNEATPSYRLFTMAARWIASMQHGVTLVAGQHDLPYHRTSANDRCALGALQYVHRHPKLVVAIESNEYDVQETRTRFCLVPFGKEPSKSDVAEVLVWHKMVCNGPADKVLMERGSGTAADAILNAYPKYKFIVTGDNHRPFLHSKGGRLLLNCGSLMRRRADQIDYQPAVWRWTEGQEPLRVPVPIAKDVVSREHIDVPQERDERLAAFVRRLDGADSRELGEGFVEAVLALLEKVAVNQREPLRRYLRAVVAGKEPDYADE